MAGELAADPTQSPWVTVEVDGHRKARCRYCLQFFNGKSYRAAVSADSHATINHFKWCEWLAAYREDFPWRVD